MDMNFKTEVLEGILETIKECIKLKELQARFAKACDDKDGVGHIAEQIAHLLIVREVVETTLAEEEEDE